jgi:hypothetical protein
MAQSGHEGLRRTRLLGNADKVYFDLARINLDTAAPAMMAPAITRIVVKSMFIDYPSGVCSIFSCTFISLEGNFFLSLIPAFMASI